MALMLEFALRVLGRKTHLIDVGAILAKGSDAILAKGSDAIICDLLTVLVVPGALLSCTAKKKSKPKKKRGENKGRVNHAFQASAKGDVGETFPSGVEKVPEAVQRRKECSGYVSHCFWGM